MALLTESRVRTAARQATATVQKSARQVLAEAAKTADEKFDIFLSHSVKDAEIVLGTGLILEDLGFSVYVDWIVDPELKRDQVTPANAALLRRRMRQCDSLLYLKTDNSADSKWMPWELGFFDALKGRVGILPVAQTPQDEFEGNEYLGLYPYVDIAAERSTDKKALWINRSKAEYGPFRDWLSDPNVIRKRA